MSHPKEELLALAAGGDLPFWSGFTVRRHLRQCAECRETVESFANLRVGLSSLPTPDAPAHLSAQVLAGVPRDNGTAHSPFRFFVPLTAAAALAAAGVVTVLVLPSDKIAPPKFAGTPIKPPQPLVVLMVPTPELPPPAPVAKFTTVADAEKDRDQRYLSSFAANFDGRQRKDPALDAWEEGVRTQRRRVPLPVIGLPAEMLRSHALPAKLDVVALPGSPVEIVSAEALFAEGRLIDPTVTVRNVSNRPIRDYQIVCVFRDASGAEFRGRMMAAGAGKVLAPGARAQLSDTIVLEPEKKKAPEAALVAARVFVRSATTSDSVWVPDRATLAAKHLNEFLPVPQETAKLLEAYRKSGVQALAQLRRPQ